MGNRLTVIVTLTAALLLTTGSTGVVRANGVDLGMLSGTLKTKADKKVPEMHYSSLKYVARFFEPNSMALDHSTDSVTFSFHDDLSGMQIWAVAPGGRDWKGKNGKFTFRGGLWSARVDQTTGLVTFKAKGFNLYDSYFQSPLSVGFTVNTDTLTIRDVWTPEEGKPGCFVYER